MLVNKVRAKEGDTTTFDQCVQLQQQDCEPRKMWLQVTDTFNCSNLSSTIHRYLSSVECLPSAGSLALSGLSTRPRLTLSTTICWSELLRNLTLLLRLVHTTVARQHLTNVCRYLRSFCQVFFLVLHHSSLTPVNLTSSTPDTKIHSRRRRSTR